MNQSSIARRYAQALFELAAEQNLFEQLERELKLTRQALEAEPNLSASLCSPAVSREEKLAMVEALVRALRLGTIMGNTLKVLSERGRLVYLSEIERRWRLLADEHVGRLRTQVTSAIPLGDETIKRMAQALSRAAARNVVIEHAVDPSIIGGIVAQVGSQVFDGSVKNQLARLKERLKV